ncbi:hypothetical protein AMS68_002243 [Peltaster fructicola]|uniref:RTA1 like protein n=1 Tax=Peltaster fructicola TaxID=286661 RepID=A0A6H0XPW4_9PEZI|nr:hypothetical protein AMS68_002243 [Peltaster fructicola]
MSTPGCTKDTCPPSASIYGYRASLPASIIFLVIFAISGILHLAIARRTWFFACVMAIGCAFEVLGYIAKLLLWNDPFSDVGFKISVVCLTLAPAFFSAAIYWTLKHLTLTIDPNLNRFNPSWYTWIFISCDIFSIVLQAIGGGVGAAATSQSQLDVSTGLLITGLSTQVATLLAFGGCAADYGLRVWRRGTSNSIVNFKLFLTALAVAYLMILLRCAYRVAELSKGWGSDNTILREQSLFIGLDSVPCALATIVLNIWHPGHHFMRREGFQDKTIETSSVHNAALERKESEGAFGGSVQASRSLE